MFPLGVLVSGAILRDREHRLEEVIFSTPVRRGAFLGSRFAGALLAALAVLSAGVAGMVAAPLSGAIPLDRLGAPGVGPYLWALAVLALPGVLVAAAALFAVGALTRSAAACHVTSVALYVLYFVAATLTSSPVMAASSPGAGPDRLAALLDPVGLSAFFEATRHFTLAERNGRLPPLAGALLANRLLWVAVSAAVLGATAWRHPFRLLEPGGRLRREPESGPVPTPPVRRGSPPRPRWIASLASSTALEARLALRGFPFPLLVGCFLVYLVPELWPAVTRGEYGSGFLPLAGLLAPRLDEPLTVLGTVAVLLWASEIFWRERTVGVEGIVHAAPVPGEVILLAKVGALAALASALALAGAATVLATQVLFRAPAFQPGVTLALAAGGAAELVLLAAGCAAVHVLAPARHVGLLLTLPLAALLLRADLLGVEHPLLRPGSLPRLRWSDLAGFGATLPDLALRGAYGAAVLGLLLAGAGLLVRRGARPARATRGLLAAAAALALVAVAAGVRLHAGLAAQGGHRTRAEVSAGKAAYERTYGAVADAPQPRIETIEARLELEPGAGRYRSRGTLRLVNDGARPIASVHVTVRREARVVSLALDRAGPPAADARHGVFTFSLDPPLAPGERTALAFDLEHPPGDPSDADVVANGSLVFGHRAFPGVGYRGSYELVEPRERRAAGLPERGRARAIPGDGDGAPVSPWVNLDLTVSTDLDQVAVAPGRLEQAWTEGGRALSRWRTDRPVHGALAVTSARYEVTRARHGEVEVELYAHPGHPWNRAAILEAARGALEVLQARFGPYPHAALRLVEVPSTWDFGGYAMPGVVLLGEHRVFAVNGRREQPIDLVVRRVAHEVAHQWWGHEVAPAAGPGAALLVEGVTKYAEARVLEALRGPEQVRSLRAFELERYLRRRGGSEEAPLVEITGDVPHLYYSKALVAFEALRERLGPDRLDGVLAAFAAAHRGPGGRATARELHARLRAAAPEADRAFVDAWLAEVREPEAVGR
ncbi:MAG: M1 family aminopeptidase [Anaeromyxobacteraceae bacterium]